MEFYCDLISVPQVHNVILVVPPVQMDVVGINQQEAKQDEQDFQGVSAAVHKVSVEDVRLLRGRKPVLDRLGQPVNRWT